MKAAHEDLPSRSKSDQSSGVSSEKGREGVKNKSSPQSRIPRRNMKKVVKTFVGKIVNVEIRPSAERHQTITALDKEELKKLYDKEKHGWGGRTLSMDWGKNQAGQFVRQEKDAFLEEELMLELELEGKRDNRIVVQVSSANLSRNPDRSRHYLYGRRLEQAGQQWASK